MNKFKVSISPKAQYHQEPNMMGSCLCSLCGRKIYTNENAFLVNHNYVLCSEECINMFILSKI
jgi:hypothetical protein